MTQENPEGDILYYLDEETGKTVFTESFLRKRGYCCNRGCRHCPYKTKSEVPPEES